MGLFAELLQLPGVEEDLVIRSAFGFLAPHGGSLEKGTDLVASAAATQAGASLYAVRQPPDLRWHIPAVAIDPAASAALTRFCAHVRAAIAVHGYFRPELGRTVLVGGANRALAAIVARHLRDRLDGGHRVIDDLASIPARLRGVHPTNVVNLPVEGGVQLELPPTARDPQPDGVAGALAAAAEEYLATVPVAR